MRSDSASASVPFRSDPKSLTSRCGQAAVAALARALVEKGEIYNGRRQVFVAGKTRFSLGLN